MKTTTTLALIFAIAQGLSLGASSAQAECTEVYFTIYDPVSDPPCGSAFTITDEWSIYVTTSPSAISAGSCSSFALDNLYANVDFYSGNEKGDCAEQWEGNCDIVASHSILSGYYNVIDVNGGCITVCANCTP